MIPSETLRVALDALLANKTRAFLTMLGVIIGSTCIVLVVTVGLTGRTYILAQIEGIGANIVYAHLVRSGEIGAALSDEISLADLEAVRHIPGVVRVAGTHSVREQVIHDGAEHPIRLVGVTEDFASIRNLALLRGRFVDRDDIVSRRKVALLSEDLATLLFGGEDPVGREVRVGEIRFTIIGVFAERISTFGQSEIQKYSAIIPHSVLRYYLGDEYLYTLYAQARSPEDVPTVTHLVAQTLQSRHRPDAVYRVENLAAILDVAEKASLALSAVLLLIAFIALIISGIGIMNVMLVTVTQRTREIGVRRAIGAHRKEILRQFLFESFLISGGGALIGILIAVGAPLLIQPFLPRGITIPISWLSVVVAFVITSLVGILFGLLPARRAAALAPTEALRYE